MTSASGINLNNEWYTPDFWLSLVNEVFETGIDLDPCSNKTANKRVQAKNYYDYYNSGLKKENEWFGKVFMNPPYSAPLLSYMLSRAVREYKKGNIDEMIVLTNSGTDTKWSRIITKDSDCTAFTIGRISFIRPNGDGYGTPSRGQMYSYLGPNKQKFIESVLKTKKIWVPNSLLLNSNRL